MGVRYVSLDRVFLIAADEDDDAFELDYKLKPLSRLAKRVNVYFNNNDRAMAVSDKSQGNPDRLGDDGSRMPRGIPGKVSLMDVHPGRVRTGAALLLSGHPGSGWRH